MSDTKVNIVNKVLRKLRESTVTTIAGDTYAELITDFLTETKTEVEDAWNWKALEGTVLLDTIASTYRYKLTNVYERSIIHEIYDQTNDNYLCFSPADVKKNLKRATPVEGTAFYWDFAGYNDSEMLLDFSDVPEIANVRLFINGKYVQGDLAYTTPDELILTPTMPLVLGTYARAVEERGEDDGETVSKAYLKYKRSIADAIALDNRMTLDENSTWGVQ